ncbi:MAG TPA: Rrf2 family transcriptional regulator [Bryobacterales bacterium]|nr:Rrf2 family transcriptional regulator [Bryobacterales bacterium]
MNISVKGDYALKAIFDLAHQGGTKPVKIADIAGRQKIPQKFLELILAQLKQGGFVQSRRGAEGGYLLARSPDTIMVGEVLRFVEGPLSPAERSRASGAASRTARRSATDTPFTEMWQRVDGAVSEIIDRTSFAELAARWTAKQNRFVANWEI